MPDVSESKKSVYEPKSEEAMSVPTEPTTESPQHLILLKSGRLVSPSESFSFKDVDWGFFNKMATEILKSKEDKEEMESQPKKLPISDKKQKILAAIEQEVEKLEKQRSFK